MSRHTADGQRTLGAMKLLALIGGALCWVVTVFMALGLIAGASDDSLSGAQALVMLAVAVVTGWAGYHLVGYRPGPRTRF